MSFYSIPDEVTSFNKECPKKENENSQRQKMKSATPSVIRRSLCMVQHKGKHLKKIIDPNNHLKKNICGVATKASESFIKYGIEVARSCDPLAAAIALGGKVSVGVSLSRFTASQCAGLFGVIVSSVTPQLSIPILLKKISEDLDYLKESLDIVRENPQYMANELISRALDKLNNYKFHEALDNFEKAGYEATRGIHMAPKFLGVLGCIQIKIFSSVMIECASNLQGIECFIPIHCLDSSSKQTVQKIITSGLETIMKKAESRKWNGKKIISAKVQNMIDPFLASLYNTYSLSASLTDPYQDCTLSLPDRVKFTIDVTYIPEGENDNCKLEVLLHNDLEIILFIWKEFLKCGQYVFVRHRMTTWKLIVTNGNLYKIEYCIVGNRMMANSGELERTVGWPVQRMSIHEMIEEARFKMDKRLKKLSTKTYKWIKKVPVQYLTSMDIDLDEKNQEGITLLHILSELNESKLMQYLVDKIENIDPCDSMGQTPLHKACATSSFKTAKLLVRNGANVNAITKSGDSPLTILSTQKSQDVKLFKMLLDLNANKNQENKDSMRAVDILKQTNPKNKLVKLLRPI